MLQLKHRMMAEGKKEEVIENEFTDLLYEIDRGIINMEKRITHIDTEHSKYIRATVSRLEYLLNSDNSLQGNVIALLNLMSGVNELYPQVASSILMNDSTIISTDSLYKKRGKRKLFEDTLETEVETEDELSKEDILRINRNKSRYSKAQIEDFIINKMEGDIYRTKEHAIDTDEEFELLILAYDYSIRRNSPFHVVPGDKGTINNGKYSYPDMIFEKNSSSC